MIRLASLRAILMMALLGSIRFLSSSYAKVKAGSFLMALQAPSIRASRTYRLLRFVMPIFASFSPEERVSGTRPMNDASH